MVIVCDHLGLLMFIYATNAWIFWPRGLAPMGSVLEPLRVFPSYHHFRLFGWTIFSLLPN